MAPFPSFTKTWHTTPYASISPELPSLSLAGKNIVITGGGSGIGRSISLALASAKASQIAIIGRRAPVLEKIAAEILGTAGNESKVLQVIGDVGDQEGMKTAFAHIHDSFGSPIDVLISNAGGYNGFQPLGAEASADWDTLVNVNIKGIAFTTDAFLAHASLHPTIVNISTAVAHLPPMKGFSSYAATKLAGTKYMQYVMDANPGLHVVDVHPGQVTSTEMASKFRGKGAEPIDDANLAANFVCWALSEEARFLRGKLVWVNWDIEEMKERAKEIETTSVLSIGLDGFADFKY